MQTKQDYNEILIFAITIIIVFLVVSALIIFILLFYQKKKMHYRQQLVDNEKEYADQLLMAKLEIQEQTFSSISDEIHDNVGQVLSLAKVQLNRIAESNILDMSLLTDARESITKAIIDLRDIAKSMSAEHIVQASMPEIIKKELERINRAGLMQATLRAEGTSESVVDDQKKVIIFRIIQEALQNILKHSQATSIDVLFYYEEKFVTISIKDNGVGFNKAIIEKKDGLGLQNILNRAILIGGKATIDSTPAEGTTITIISPYE